MARGLIGLGANLGDPAVTLRAVLDQLAQHPRIHQLDGSRFYATAPIGGPPSQPSFVNAAASFETDLPPEALLDELQALERAFGRERGETWAARTLDLDLLLYDAEQLATPRLTLPHPRLAFRRFVLEPAAEIAGEMIDPTTRLTVSQLLMQLNAPCRYVALAGSCWFAKQYVMQSAVGALHEAGVPVQASTARGMTVIGAPPTEDPEHSFVEHFVDLLPRLADDLEPPPPQTWLLSSFWSGELELAARLWFAGRAREAAERAYAETAARFPTPKLLVYLHTPDDLLLFDPAQPNQAPAWYEHARRLAAHRDALEEQVSALRGVPVLRLTAAEPETAIRELHAAVLAMR